MPNDPINEKAVFNLARAKASPEERMAYLQNVCGHDPDAMSRIRNLLRVYDQEKSFLESPPVAAGATADFPVGEQPGARIGPYKLLEQIGEGGFGVVYMAEQMEPVRRKVALKILKPGIDTRQIVARFEAERQALAIMDHPNIAKVFDAGSTEVVASLRDANSGRGATGLPYFAMELVKGMPITDYCDQNHLTPRQRLELFIPVCQAVQHAHQKGIIHRDLKPSNILVSRHDTTPVPKVIDFGVAKALGQELTDKTLFTGIAQMIGTPLYMSPEQAGMSDLDVDTRSDIYSLGVLLYELLTGTTPIEKERFKNSAYDEIRRIIRDEEPPRPSTRLSDLSRPRLPGGSSGGPARQAGPTSSLASVSAMRQTEPAKLTKLVKGELDWIVMKALEKDRNRRYESANSLAADVQRYLNDEAVQACPPSTWYRFGKFTKRNRREVLGAGLAAVAGLVGVAGLGISRSLIASALKAETDAKDKLDEALKAARVDAYFHRIALAHRELSAYNLKRALELLEECPEYLRGWEWHFLKRLCREDPVILQDDVEVRSIAFHPDGILIAAACGDGNIKIWNGKTRRVFKTLKNAHEGFASSVAFHAEGKHLASVGKDQIVKVWDLTTGEKMFEAPCDAVHGNGAAYAVAFSPDGRMLATGNKGVVTLWDWRNGQILHSLVGHANQQISVAFSHDGQHLASGDWAGNIRLWDAGAGAGPPRTFRETDYPISALAFNKDGDRLAAATFNSCVDVWDTKTTERVHQTLRHSGGIVLAVAFSPDGRRLASTGDDKTVHIWEAASGREVLSLRGHDGICVCLAFSPDGHRLASASEDKTIRIWDATPLPGDEAEGALTWPANNEIWSLAVSPDGQKIASAGRNMPVQVRDARTGLDSVPLPGLRTIVFCVVWRNQWIAAAGGNGAQFTVKVWDARTRGEVCALPPTGGGTEYMAVAFSPDGRFLVTGSKDGKVMVWSAENGQPVGMLGTHVRQILGLVFSPDGKRLASASGDGKIQVWAWDPTRPGQLRKSEFECDARIPGVYLNMAFSPDGRWLAHGGEVHAVKIRDAKTGRELKTLHGHGGDVSAAAFSLDGRCLATAGEDTTIRIWDARYWKFRQTLRGHTGVVSSLAFIPKTKQLVSGSRDHTIKVWEATRWDESPDH